MRRETIRAASRPRSQPRSPLGPGAARQGERPEGQAPNPPSGRQQEKQTAEEAERLQSTRRWSRSPFGGSRAGRMLTQPVFRRDERNRGAERIDQSHAEQIQRD